MAIEPKFKVVDTATVSRLRFGLNNLNDIKPEVKKLTPNINSIEDFVKFTEEHGIDIELRLKARTDGQAGAIKVAINKSSIDPNRILK
jgi:hypothetical protein